MHQQTHDTTFTGWEKLNKNHANMRDNQVFREGSFGVRYYEGMEPDLARGEVVVGKHWNSRSVSLSHPQHAQQRGADMVA